MASLISKGKNIMNTATQNLPLIISDTFIHQDAEARYCLNDVHKAAGENPKHQPSNWLRLDSTKELIEEVSRCSEMSNRSSDLRNGSSIMMNPIEVKQGGNQQGTYAVKELVYAYAMWISPAFSLKVIRAYDALVMGTSIPEQKYGELLDKFLALNNDHIALLREKISSFESAIRLRVSPRKCQPDEIAAALRCRQEGFSYRDIAELLGRSKESVNHMVRRAEGRS
jgi:hypothetical protein